MWQYSIWANIAPWNTWKVTAQSELVKLKQHPPTSETVCFCLCLCVCVWDFDWMFLHMLLGDCWSGHELFCETQCGTISCALEEAKVMGLKSHVHPEWCHVYSLTQGFCKQQPISLTSELRLVMCCYCFHRFIYQCSVLVRTVQHSDVTCVS